MQECSEGAAEEWAGGADKVSGRGLRIAGTLADMTQAGGGDRGCSKLPITAGKRARVRGWGRCSGISAPSPTVQPADALKAFDAQPSCPPTGPRWMGFVRPARDISATATPAQPPPPKEAAAPARSTCSLLSPRACPTMLHELLLR